MSEKKIKTETKSNIWKNVRKIATVLIPIVVVILRGGRGKPNA